MKKLITIFSIVMMSALFCGCDDGGSGSDATPPQITLVFPGRTSLTDEPYLRIQGTTQDESGVKRVSVDGKPATTEDDYASWASTYYITSNGHHHPVIIATDNGGNFRVTEITIQGVKTDALMDATVGMGLGFSNNMANLATGLDGEIYIMDVGRNAVIGVDPVKGRRSIVADPDSIGGLVFVQPVLVAADSDGTLIVVDGHAGYGFRILRIDPVAATDELISFTKSHPGPQMQMPTGVATGDDGTIYIADFERRAVFGIDPNNGARRIISDGRVSPVFYPYALAVDIDGTLLVSDDGMGRLFRIDPETGSRVSFEPSNLLPTIEGIAPLGGDSIAISSRTSDDSGQWRITVCSRTGQECSIVSDNDNGDGPEPMEYIASIGIEPGGSLIGLDLHPERRAVMRIDPESGDRVIISKGLID